MRDTSFLVSPSPEHALFEKAQFQCLFGNRRLQIPWHLAQGLDFIAAGSAGRISGQTFLPRFQELLRPVGIRLSAMPSGRHRAAMLSSPRSPSRTMRTFSSAEKRRCVTRRMSFDNFQCLFFSRPGFPSHLRSLISYDEPKILLYANTSNCLTGPEVGQKPSTSRS